MTTTTAEVIITDALKEIQVLGDGTAIDSVQLADGLRMLNRLMDVLSNKRDFAYIRTDVSRALTGEASFTIGPTGTTVAARPIKIDSAYVVLSGSTYPVEILDNERWDRILYKAITGGNTAALYYYGSYPDGVVYVYPLATGCTLHLRTVVSVKQFAATTTQIDMPQGYEDYLMLGLAIRAAPSYGAKVSDDTRRAYRAAKALVTRTNIVIPTLELPGAVLGGTVTYADCVSGNL